MTMFKNERLQMIAEEAMVYFKVLS